MIDWKTRYEPASNTQSDYEFQTSSALAEIENGLDDDKGLEATAAGLIRVAPYAEEVGVTLVLELLNSKVDYPDYQADRTAWGVQVCEMVLHRG